MKRTFGFFWAIILVILCKCSFAMEADTSKYQYQMTGEELIKLMLINSIDTLNMTSCLFSTEIQIPLGTQIRRPIKFNNCMFKKVITLKSSNLFNACCFDKCNFLVQTDFSANHFHGEVVFSSCEFSDSLNFSSCIFKKKADFRNCIFVGETFFLADTFKEEANFYRCSFIGNVYFRTSTFYKKTSFEGTKFLCVYKNLSIEVQGMVDFRSTKWHETLNFRNTESHQGVKIEFAEAQWVNAPMTISMSPRPILYLEGADYDKLLFPIADEKIPNPILGFGNADSSRMRSGWRAQIPDPDQIEWSAVQRTYGKFLTFLKDNGRYDDYDALLKEFHYLETRYKWHSGDWITPIFNTTLNFICGYGIDPKRSFYASILIVMVFAVFYRFPFSYRLIHPRIEKDRDSAIIPPPPLLKIGKQPGRQPIWRKKIERKDRLQWFVAQFNFFLDFILFSLNTFCTVGYDNNYPVRWLRHICMLELILGYITLTLFLVSLINVLLR